MITQQMNDIPFTISEPFPENWFDHNSRIHGVTHTQRVCHWVIKLSSELFNKMNEGLKLQWFHQLKISEIEKARNLALLCAVIHDLARTHDGACTEHGKRAAETKRHILEKNISGPLDQYEWNIISYAVTKHSLPDSVLCATTDDLVLAILKDADALDRVRFCNGQPDPRYFRFPFTKHFINDAGDLYRNIQNINLEGIG